VQVLGNEQIVLRRTPVIENQSVMFYAEHWLSTCCNSLVLNREVLKKEAKYFFGIAICSTFTMVAAHPINRSTH
jgi:hypothetical protein